MATLKLKKASPEPRLALNALKKVKTSFPKTVVENSPKEKAPNTPQLSPIENYNKALKIDQKIAYALTNLKSATKKEIVSFLISTDPSLDKIKLENNITVRLSLLLGQNLIEANKKGRTYCYNLIR